MLRRARRALLQTVARVTGAGDAAWRCAGWMTHRGARIVHTGVLLDQPAVTALLDEVVRKLAAATDRPADVLHLLRSTWIVVRPGASVEIDGAEYTCVSRVYTGPLARGVVTVAVDAEHAHQRLAAQLVAVLAHRMGVSVRGTNAATVDGDGSQGPDPVAASLGAA